MPGAEAQGEALCAPWKDGEVMRTLNGCGFESSRGERVALATLLLVLGAATVARAGAPEGRLEWVSPDGVVTGWAWDPDTPGARVDVHLYVDAPYGTYVGRAWAADDGGPSGFRFHLPARLLDGQEHRLYAYALDTAGQGHAPLLGNERAFTLGPTAGRLDGVGPTGAARGWALRGDAALEPVTVELCLQGGSSRAAAVSASTGRPRADVAAARDTAGLHGFEVALPVAEGPLGVRRQVHAWARDARGRRAPLAGSPRTVRRAHTVIDVCGPAYGAVPDDGLDDGPAIRKAVDEAIQATRTAGPGAVVYLPAGVYHLKPLPGRLPFYDYCLQLGQPSGDDGVTGLDIVGDNAVLRSLSPTSGIIRLDDGVDCSLRGLTLDYERPPFSQGTVLAVDRGRRTFDVELDVGFPDIMGAEFLDASDPAASYRTHILEPWGRELKRTRGDFTFVGGWTPLGGRRYRLQAKDDALDGVAPGDRYVHFVRLGAHAIYLEDSSRCLLEDVTIHASPALAVASVACDALELRRLEVRYRDGQGRLISTNADGYHCQQNRRGSSLEQCLFEGMMDDAINVYCHPNVVHAVAGRTWTVGAWTRLRAGDNLQALDPRTGDLLGEVRALSVERRGADYLITVDRELAGVRPGVDHRDATTLYNLDACGRGSRFIDTVARNHRGVAFKLKTWDARVQGSRIWNLSRVGISIVNEPDWPEGPLPGRITLIDTEVARVGRSADGLRPEHGAIVVGARKLDYQVADSARVPDVRLLRTRVEDWARAGLLAGGAERLVVSGATFDASGVAPPGLPVPAALRLTRARALLRGVQVRDPRPGAHAGVALREPATVEGALPPDLPILAE